MGVCHEVASLTFRSFSTPTLLAVDEINALYTKTAYHDTDSQVLDAHRLRLPRTILDYFAGNKQFVSVIE